MGYKSYASLVIALTIFALPTVADVMDEYRDPSFTGGYVVSEYLFDETSEQEQKSLPIYGEYNVSAYATLYYRTQQAKFENKTINGQVPDKAKYTDHISAFGTRLRYRFGEDDHHEIGTLLTLSQRDFNEINGLTYRVMPYVYLFSGRTFSARAHIEWDFIERDAWNAEVEDQLRIKSEDREAGLYLRANLTNILGYVSDDLQPDSWSISYEDKLATNIDEDAWGISHEHTLSLDHENGWSMIVAQQKTSPTDTANINPFKKVTKAGYTTIQVKRQF